MGSKEGLINRLNHTADTYEKIGARNWAQAKSGEGEQHYAKARNSYERAETCRKKAKDLMDD